VNFSKCLSTNYNKSLELSTNSPLADNPAYRLIDTYKDVSGPQKLIEVETINGDKAYYIQYIANAPRYSIFTNSASNLRNFSVHVPKYLLVGMHMFLKVI